MGASSNRLIAVGLMGVVAVAAGVGLGLVKKTASTPITAGSSAGTFPTQASTIEVHVAGWVVTPGIVTLPDGSIVADAIAAAGGLRPGASSGSINLAAEITAGDQIVVPGPDGSVAQGSSEGGVLSLNRATATELQSLPGVGPVLAERIVAHRESHGRFETVEDLLTVSGIGEAKLAAIRDLVSP